MRREDDRRSAARWRAVLEARWRIRLQEVTELSVAYHGAASDDTEDRRARRLLRRAVAARQRLADTEAALGRVTAGAFGRCEQCGARISEVLLAAAPESRYCPRCAAAASGTRSASPRRTAGPRTAGPGADFTRAGAAGTGTAGPRAVGARAGAEARTGVEAAGTGDARAGAAGAGAAQARAGCR
jgi:RNA polymerase-binding transcription factor DksA